MHANAVPEQDIITCDIEIAAPPERVFRALTDPVQARRWFGGGPCEITLYEMDARLGGRWRFVARDTSPSRDLEGQFKVSEFEHHGEILEFDPPRLLVYTWFTNFHRDPTHPTVVRWELTPTPSGTRVKLTHSGLASEPESRKAYSGGWVGVLQAIKTSIESEASS